MHQVEQLALVFVYPFDLYIEQGLRVDHNPQTLINQRRQGAFVLQALFGEAFAKVCPPGKRLQLDQFVFGFIEHIRPQCIHQHGSQRRVGLEQPAAEGYAVGLVVDAIGVELVQLGEHGAAHQLRVQPGNPVDAVGA